MSLGVLGKAESTGVMIFNPYMSSLVFGRKLKER